MSRSVKDRANYFRFHDDKEMPTDVKPVADLLDWCYAGYRSGNNRRSDAREKVHERRVERKKRNRNIELD